MIKRIEKILLKYNLSHSEFADKLGLSRSNISHIFSGRNKPSLDFILKIHKCFPNENLYWLLTGLKEKPHKELKPTSSPSFSTKKLNLFETPIKCDLENQKTIERIVVFFDDGSFKNYNS